MKRNHDGVTLTQVTHGVDQGTPQTSNRGRYWCFCAIVIVLIYEETAVSFSHLLFFSAWAVMRRTSSILPNGRMTSSRLRLNQPAKQTAVKIRSKRRVKECEWERCMTTRAKNKMSSRFKAGENLKSKPVRAYYPSESSTGDEVSPKLHLCDWKRSKSAILLQFKIRFFYCYIL